MNFQISGRWTALTSIQLLQNMEQQVYHTKAQDVNDLRWRLTDMWIRVEQSITELLMMALNSSTNVSMPAFEPQ